MVGHPQDARANVEPPSKRAAHGAEAPFKFFGGDVAQFLDGDGGGEPIAADARALRSRARVHADDALTVAQLAERQLKPVQRVHPAMSAQVAHALVTVTVPAG